MPTRITHNPWPKKLLHHYCHMCTQTSISASEEHTTDLNLHNCLKLCWSTGGWYERKTRPLLNFYPSEDFHRHNIAPSSSPRPNTRPDKMSSHCRWNVYFAACTWRHTPVVLQRSDVLQCLLWWCQQQDMKTKLYWQGCWRWTTQRNMPRGHRSPTKHPFMSVVRVCRDICWLTQ